MENPCTVNYKIEYNELTGIYTGYCPDINAVMFSGKDQSQVKELVEDGIQLFLEKNPDYFDSFKIV